MGQYKSITIKDAMVNISQNKYLLPAIQRKFVWSIEQVEMLFDSILRNYPINSFMLWKITDDNIKKNYKFYQFIKDYVQKFHEDNPDAATEFCEDSFHAVIDGQQRLNSLYIGLAGSYKVKKTSKWWQETEEKTPMLKKMLYLELSNPLSSNIDNEKYYNFKFLSQEDKEKDEKENPDHIWFLVANIIRRFNDEKQIRKYLSKNNLIENNFAENALLELHKIISEQQMINYYEVDDQDQDRVLDIFIRTNSGGTPLSFSDLLMSIASANWTKYDARKEMSVTKASIYSYGHPCFDVSQDFILKSILVLTDCDIKFKINNFGKDNISIFESQWEKIKASLIATFNLLEHLGFNNETLRAKNAAIPIAYYIYKKDIAKEIVKPTYSNDDKRAISKWLTMTLLKGIFGGQSDGVLKSLRDIIKNNLDSIFPLDKIIDAFKGNTDKNYKFDEDVINLFIKAEYGSITCGLTLMLLYPDIVLEHGKEIAQDHMHPKSLFEKKNFINLGISLEDREFCLNNYNNVLNLQLLQTTINNSKSDMPLIDWVGTQTIRPELYVDKDCSLEIKDFKSFIMSREKHIITKLKEILDIK